VVRQTPEEELKQLLLSSELGLLSELEARLGEIQARVGDDEVLQESLRRVIVDVLRDAGAEDHQRLSTILAPLMLSSLQTEIRNSRELMVEALYPLTGRLVSSAVKNAFRDMLQNLDTRVSNTLSFANLRLRIRALITRRPYGELVLQRASLFRVDETLVIHRTTGLLITRVGPEEEDDDDVDRDLVGSMLNAVMSLTKDAFGDDKSGELSALEFGDAQLFVKSSPTLILVVVVRGAPPADLATHLEELFVSFLERWGSPLSEFDGDLDIEDEVGLISDVRARVQSLIRDEHRSSEPESIRRPGVVFAILVLLLFSWVAARSLEGYRIRSFEEAALGVVESHVAFAGYPISVAWDAERDVLSVNGLAPDAEARDALERSITEAVDVGVVYTINTLPQLTIAPDPIEELERFAEQNAIYFSEGRTLRLPDRAEQVLGDLAAHLLSTPEHVRVRIIGYADPLGAPEVNQQLTLARADVAYERLLAFGVPEARMVTVGRPGERLLTQTVGAGSDSRRTEFEVYYTER
jgi:outer membrane protein OmpA-like peptidoglycan-associated protein